VVGVAKSGGRGATRWGGATAVPTHARLHGVRGHRVRGRRELFPSSFPLSVTLVLLSYVISPSSSRDGPGRRAKGRLQRAAAARTAERKWTANNIAMISIGRMRLMNKLKKIKNKLS